MKSPTFPWFGALLILVGVALLLDRLHVLYIGFGHVLWAAVLLLGALHVAQGFSLNARGKIFWGTVIFLYGLYFLLHTFPTIVFRSHLFVPATFLIIGAGFFMMYLNNFRKWSLLIPAIILFSVGTAILLGRLELSSFWEVGWSIRRYWPVVLILLGLIILLKNQVKRRKTI